MPLLPESIELHDSQISAIEQVNGVMNIHLSPAYIHCDGKGWSQHAIIRITSNDKPPLMGEFPVRIADGSLMTKQGPYHNLLMLPLTEKGPVSLSLELMSGKVVNIAGDGADVVLVGDRVFIENTQ